MIYLVGVEIRGINVDFKQIVTAGQL